MSARHIISDVLLFSGVACILIACLGVAVVSSAYDRLHFTSPALLGSLLIAAAVLVQESFSLVGDKALLVAALLLAGSPLLTHATARSARIREQGDWRLSSQERERSEAEGP